MQLAVSAAYAGDRGPAASVEPRLAAQDTKYHKGAWQYQRARLAAVLGDRRRAVSLLREAEQQGFATHMYAHSSPELRLLKGDPGFEELIRARR